MICYVPSSVHATNLFLMIVKLYNDAVFTVYRV